MSTTRIGSRTIDLEAGEVVGFGALAQRELALLKYLLQHPDRVIGPDELLRQVWGFADGVRTRAIYTAIYRLRSLIEEDPANPRFILSERGAGYRLRLPSAGRRAFPVPIDPFVGRGALFERLARTIAASRIVTLVGAPGIGKTRLALEIGSLWHAEGRDVLLVSGQAGLLGGLAASLGVSADPEGADLFDLVRRSMADGRWLVVADDVDHSQSDLLQLAELVAAVPGLSLLATAHSPLGVPSEHVIDVGPIDIDASMALLSVRIGQELPISPENLLGLAERLEGIPLALELGASLVMLLGAMPSLALLQDSLEPLQLVTGPHRSGLVAAIERSWRALPGEDRRWLVSLAAFRGGFGIAEASGVLGTDALPIIARLRKRSLLFLRGDQRFGMFEGVREFVQRNAEPEVWRAARLRHAEWFAGWVLRLEADETSLRQLDLAMGNTRAAIDALVDEGREPLACAVLEVILHSGTHASQEMVDLAMRGLALTQDASVRSRFEAHVARHLRAAHRFGEALATARRAVAGVAPGDLEGRLQALRSLMLCCVVSGEIPEALGVVEQLLVLAPELDERTRLRAEIDAARVFGLSDPAGALGRLEGLEPRIEAVALPTVRSHADAVRAFTLMRTDPAQSELELARVERWCRANGQEANAESLLGARVQLVVRAGRAGEAAALLPGILGDPPSPFASMMAAWVAWLGDRVGECREHLVAAIGRAQQIQDPFGQSLATGALAQLLRAEGRTTEAVSMLDRAATLHQLPAAKLMAWSAAVLAEREPEHAERLLRTVGSDLVGAGCARLLLDSGAPEPSLDFDHDLVDRIGLDLTLRAVRARSG